MSIAGMNSQGAVIAFWRYPVKSMRGEELDATEITERGLVGDRAFALVDEESHKVVSAKNPRKWGNMFQFQAAFMEPPRDPGALPPARITFPDGTTSTTADPDIHRLVSAHVGRPVHLAAAVPAAPRIEGYWPDYDWLEAPDKVFEVELPPGTFFDAATIHLLTTATLKRLGTFAPQSRFDVRRFRPNIVIKVSDTAGGFVEAAWVGRTLSLGSEVRLRVTGPCPRCVMTTLNQAELPKDPNVLRTLVQHNSGNVGVLASVVRGGRARRDDAVVLE